VLSHLVGKERYRALAQALCKACAEDNQPLAKDLLDEDGVKHFVNEYDNNGVTALYLAVSLGHLEIFKEVRLSRSLLSSFGLSFFWFGFFVWLFFFTFSSVLTW
jgi:hypothetical protein